MKKKILTMLLVGIFLATGISSATGMLVVKKEETSEVLVSNQVINDIENNNFFSDYLDQYTEGLQLDGLKILNGPNYHFIVAQSFKPSLPILTSIKLRLFKSGSVPEVLTVSIRESLIGNDLITYSIFENQIFIIPSWITIDFDDLNVNIGQQYFIICESLGGNIDNYFAWSFSIDKRYWKGEPWINTGSGWVEEWYYNYDLSFETYGYDPDNMQPQQPDILSKSNGQTGIPQEFIISSVDTDGDDVCYWIDWDDGTVDEWSNFYNSDKYISFWHTFEEAGTYKISAMAKDTKGAESNWATLEVTMPRNKAVNNPFLNFLQQHPNMFPLLQMLLQRLGIQ